MDDLKEQIKIKFEKGMSFMKKNKGFLLRIVKCIYVCFVKEFLIKNLILEKTIPSLFSPHVMMVLIPCLLGYHFNEDISKIVIETQSKMLLQKELTPLQYQVTKTWIATQTLFFLFHEYSKPQNKNKIEKSKIVSAYAYWKEITNDWKNKWQDKFDTSLKNLKGNKKDLHRKFKMLTKDFEENFYIKLSNCHKNYFSKNKKCSNTLPYPANVTQFQKKLYFLYLLN